MYDAVRKRWHQTWVDDKGNVLLLDGEWKGGRMVLEGERPVAGGKTSRERITWTPQAGGGVRQLWESSTDSGKTWQVAFDGDLLVQETVTIVCHPERSEGAFRV